MRKKMRGFLRQVRYVRDYVPGYMWVTLFCGSMILFHLWSLTNTPTAWAGLLAVASGASLFLLGFGVASRMATETQEMRAYRQRRLAAQISARITRKLKDMVAQSPAITKSAPTDRAKDFLN